MERYQQSVGHLIDLILNRNNSTPNFALLIGAGASVTSGVKPASQMIEEWRQQLYEQSGVMEEYDEWLSKQEWFNSDQEYSILFEKAYDLPAQRRTYIENCIKDAKPSWGYIYLSNIIANNYFNIVFTTNFDDLLNEACFLYAEVKPLVCAHDSAVANIRVTSVRPKIIKLHGDFLYDNIKNTTLETKVLEKNMEDKLVQFAREYGLVVVGYGGNDESIMRVLRHLVKTNGYLPNGIYWCVRKDAEPSKKVKDLLRRDRVYWVEVEGFREFMAQLHRKAGLELPDIVKDPYKATTNRLNTFISRVGSEAEGRQEIQNPIILADMNQLQETIKAFEGAISGKEEAVLDKLVPYAFLGSNAFTRHEYGNSVTYFRKAQMLGLLTKYDMQLFAFSYLFLEDFEDAQTIIEQMLQSYPESPIPYLAQARLYYYAGDNDRYLASLQEALRYAPSNEIKSAVLVSISNAKLLLNDFTGALTDAQESIRLSKKERSAINLNRSIALKKLDRVDEAKTILDNVLKRETDHYFRACAFATLDDKQSMLKELKLAIDEDSRCVIDAKSDPDFIDYRDDPEFKRIAYKQHQIASE